MADDTLTLRWPGGEFTSQWHSEITIGREAGNSVVLTSTAVSRRHATVTWEDGGWTFCDRSSTQGSFAAGTRVTELRLQAPTEIVLGRGPDAVTVRFDVPVGAAVTDTANRPTMTAQDPTPIVEYGQRPGGALANDAVHAATVVPAASDDRAVRLTAGDRSIALRPGESATVGRDGDNDLVVSGPSVSRRHLRVEYGDDGWSLVDLRSSAGTWLDGLPVERIELSGDQTFSLGERTGTALLEVSSPMRSTGGGPVPAQARSGSRSGSKPWLYALAAVVVIVVAVAASAFWWLPKGGGLDKDRLYRATVRIDAPEWSGSGTIIDAKAGLILTNAHVAAPNALGTSVNHELFTDEDEDQGTDPISYHIDVDAGRDKAAEPRFVGHTVASDGYLDLAILKIDRTASGAAVTADDLKSLVSVPLGNSNAVGAGDTVIVLGYPRAADSRAATYTKGVVSGVQGDSRMAINNAWLNFDASSAHGNSGGLAVDSRGRMIGVPSLGLIDTQDQQAVLAAMRPISLAMPMINAVRAGKPYVSPWTVDAPGSAAVTSIEAAAPGAVGSVTASCQSGSSPANGVSIGVNYTGFGGGTHTDVLAELRAGGKVVGRAISTFPTALPAAGCATITFAPVGSAGIPAGSYGLVIGVGGNYKPVHTSTLTIGAASPPAG